MLSLLTLDILITGSVSFDSLFSLVSEFMEVAFFIICGLVSRKVVSLFLGSKSEMFRSLLFEILRYFLVKNSF